jgi:hypothetical protein
MNVVNAVALPQRELSDYRTASLSKNSDSGQQLKVAAVFRCYAVFIEIEY